MEDNKDFVVVMNGKEYNVKGSAFEKNKDAILKRDPKASVMGRYKDNDIYVPIGQMDKARNMGAVMNGYGQEKKKVVAAPEQAAPVQKEAKPTTPLASIIDNKVPEFAPKIVAPSTKLEEKAPLSDQKSEEFKPNIGTKQPQLDANLQPKAPLISEKVTNVKPDNGGSSDVMANPKNDSENGQKVKDVNGEFTPEQAAQVEQAKAIIDTKIDSLATPVSEQVDPVQLGISETLDNISGDSIFQKAASSIKKVDVKEEEKINWTDADTTRRSELEARQQQLDEENKIFVANASAPHFSGMSDRTEGQTYKKLSNEDKAELDGLQSKYKQFTKTAEFAKKVEEAKIKLVAISEKTEQEIAAYEREHVLKDYQDGPLNVVKPLIKMISAAFDSNYSKLRAIQRKEEDLHDSLQQYGNDDGFFVDAVNGMWDESKRGRLFDLYGVADMQSSAVMYNIKNKVDKGEELGENERTLAELYILAGQVQYDQDIGYSAGQTTAQSLPFMVDMYTNPLNGALKGVRKTLTKKLGSAFIKKGLKKDLQLTGKVASDAASKAAIHALEHSRSLRAFNLGVSIGTDALETFGMTATTGIARVASSALDREGGSLFNHEDGSIGVKGHNEIGYKEMAKGFGSQWIEYFTEDMGEYMGPLASKLGGKLGKGISRIADTKIGKRLSLDKVTDFVGNVSTSDANKAITSFLAKTKWNGTVGEYSEEILGTVMNSFFIGDQKYSDLLDGRQQLKTFLGVGLFGGFTSGVSTVGYVKQQIGYRNTMLTAKSGVSEKASRYIDDIESGEDNKILDALDEAMNATDLTNVDKKALLFFSGSVMQYRGSNVAALKRNTEGKEDVLTLRLNEAYQTAFDSEKYDATSKTARLTSLESYITTDLMNADVPTVEKIVEGLEEKGIDTSIEREYLTLKAERAGRRQRKSSKIKSIFNSTKMAMGRKKQNSFDSTTIINIDGASVTKKGQTVLLTGQDGKKAYVRGGDISLVQREDGSLVVNQTKSDGKLVIVDENGDNPKIVATVDFSTAEYTPRDEINKTIFHEAEAEAEKSEIKENAKVEADKITKEVEEQKPLEDDVEADDVDDSDGFDDIDDSSDEELADITRKSELILYPDGKETTFSVLWNKKGSMTLINPSNGERTKLTYDEIREISKEPEQEPDIDAIVDETLKLREENEAAPVANEEGIVANEEEIPESAPILPEAAPVANEEEVVVNEPVIPVSEPIPAIPEVVPEKQAAPIVDEAAPVVPEIKPEVTTIEDKQAKKDLDAAIIAERVNKRKLTKKQREILKNHRQQLEDDAAEKLKAEAEKLKAETEKAAADKKAKEKAESDAAKKAESIKKENDPKYKKTRDKFEASERIVGNDDSISFGNDHIDGSYVLIEAGSSTPSHDPMNGYKKSDGFPTHEDGSTVNDRPYDNKESIDEVNKIGRGLSQEALESPVVVSKDGIVLSGNGRTMGGDLAARDGKDSQYIDYLLKHGIKFGFDKSAIDKFKHPRVVFIPNNFIDYTTENFQKFNVDKTKVKSGREKAIGFKHIITDKAKIAIINVVSKAKTITEFLTKPTLAREFFNVLVKHDILSTSDKGGMLYEGNSGSFTESGKEYSKNVIVGLLFDKDDLITLLAGNDEKSVRNNILRAAPSLLRIRKLEEGFRLDKEMENLIKILEESSKKGMDIPTFISSADVFEGSPVHRYGKESLILALALRDNSTAFSDIITSYADAVENNKNIVLGDTLDKEEMLSFYMDVYVKEKEAARLEQLNRISLEKEASNEPHKTKEENERLSKINFQDSSPIISEQEEDESGTENRGTEKNTTEVEPDTTVKPTKESKTKEVIPEVKKPEVKKEDPSPTKEDSTIEKSEIDSIWSKMKSIPVLDSFLKNDIFFGNGQKDFKGTFDKENIKKTIFKLTIQGRANLGGIFFNGVEFETTTKNTSPEVISFLDRLNKILKDGDVSFLNKNKSLDGPFIHINEGENDISILLKEFDGGRKAIVDLAKKHLPNYEKEQLKLDKAIDKRKVDKAKEESNKRIAEVFGSKKITEDNKEKQTIKPKDNENGPKRNDVHHKSDGDVSNKSKKDAKGSEGTTKDAEGSEHPNGKVLDKRKPTDKSGSEKGHSGGNIEGDSSTKLLQSDKSIGDESNDKGKKSPTRQDRRNTRNFKIKEEGAERKPHQRYVDNVTAIRLAKKIIEEKREATADEKEVLGKYVGWGGLSAYFDPMNNYRGELQKLLGDSYRSASNSTTTSFYTPIKIVDTLWDIAAKLGFKGGHILEPSVGVGNILGRIKSDMSDKSHIQAVELDEVTGMIAKLLYPDADIAIKGFEQQHIAANSKDLVIANVPFASKYKVYDKEHKDISKFNLHNFFIAKSVRLLKPGGLGIFISTSSSMDKSTKFLEWLDTKGNADVIDVARLNNRTFSGDANTNVTSDIIIIRKRDNNGKSPYAKDAKGITILREITSESLPELERGRLEGRAEYSRRVKESSRGKKFYLSINKYLASHLNDRVGGIMKINEEMGINHFNDQQACDQDDSIDQDKMLQTLIESLPSDLYSAKKTEASEKREQTDEKEGTVVVKDGKVYRVEHGELGPVLNKAKKKEAKGKDFVVIATRFNKVKDSLKELLDAEQRSKGGESKEINEARKKLNNTFDELTDNHGHFGRTNKKYDFLRNNDITFYSISALEKFENEHIGENGKVIPSSHKKTDIFKNRQLEKEVTPKPKSVEDAIGVSVFKYGQVDVSKIAELLGRDDLAAIRKSILNSGLAFEDPNTGVIETRSNYLSGNVREKYDDAKRMNGDGKFDTNIKELKAIIPTDIPIQNIKVRLGSAWIPDNIYSLFFNKEFGVTREVIRMPNGRFAFREDYEQHIDYSYLDIPMINAVSGKKLALACLNNSNIGFIRKELTSEQIAYVYDQIDEAKADLNTKFREWVSKSEHSKELEQVYNEKENCMVETKSEATSFDYFPNASHSKKPYEHQKKGVMRCLNGPTLLAHEVGTGKTITLISAAMEMKRLGIAKKPTIVVQASTFDQFMTEIKELYPQAIVMAPTSTTLTGHEKEVFLSQVAYNNCDIVVLYHSLLDDIPNDPDREIQAKKDAIQDKIDMINFGFDNKGSISRQAQSVLSKGIDKLTKEIKEISNKKLSVKAEATATLKATSEAEKAYDMDHVSSVTFEQTGIDALLVDEAHRYKKLGFETNQGQVKGIDKTFAKATKGLKLKTDYILEHNNNKNVVFATGTPISNTMAEMWTYMRFLKTKEQLAEAGMGTFDEFANTWGTVTEGLEFTASGRYKKTKRFAKFNNVPELIKHFKQIAHIILTSSVEQLKSGIGTPLLVNGKHTDIVIESNPMVLAIMKAISRKFDIYDKMPKSEKALNRHIPLCAFTLAKKAAIDVRLVNPELGDSENSKVNKAVELTLSSLNETKSFNGTVSIFSDLYQSKDRTFNVFKDIKEKLVKQGVPEDQICIIHDLKSDQERANTFAKVNTGSVRVILGTTQKLGVGVNIQERMQTLIHLDAPTRPSDYKQRNGRMQRQGNTCLKRDAKTKEFLKMDSHGKLLDGEAAKSIHVNVIRLGVSGTLDVTGFERLNFKADFSDDLLNHNDQIRDMEEDDEENLGFAEFTQALSGSEKLREKAKKQRDLDDLIRDKSNVAESNKYTANSLAQANAKIEILNEKIAESNKEKTEVLENHPEGKVSNIVIGKKTIKQEFPMALEATLGKIVDKITDVARTDIKKHAETDIKHVIIDKESFTIHCDVSIDKKITRKFTITREDGDDYSFMGDVKAGTVHTLIDLLNKRLSIESLDQPAIDAKYSLEKNEELSERLSKVKPTIFAGDKKIERLEEQIEDLSKKVEEETDEKQKSLMREGGVKDLNIDNELAFKGSAAFAEWEDSNVEQNQISTDEIQRDGSLYNRIVKLLESVGINVNHFDDTILRDDNSILYGFVDNGEINITEFGHNANTPIHEYTHIWDTAMQNDNPELWNEGVELMKQTTLWDEVVNDKNYENVKEDEDVIASEVHARLTGNKAEASFKEMEKKSRKKGFVQFSNTLALNDKVKAWIKSTNTWLKNLFSNNKEIAKLSLEDFIDKPIIDLLNQSKLDEGSEADYLEELDMDEEREFAARLGSDIQYISVANVSEIEGIEDAENKRNSKGWYDEKSNRVYIITDNTSSKQDVIETILHEIVGKKSMRQIFGDKYEEFLTKIRRNIPKVSIDEISHYAKKNDSSFMEATEEYLARIAETGYESNMDRDAWAVIKDGVRELTHRMNRLVGFNYSDSELRYMLWKNHRLATSKGGLLDNVIDTNVSNQTTANRQDTEKIVIDDDMNNPLNVLDKTTTPLKGAELSAKVMYNSSLNRMAKWLGIDLWFKVSSVIEDVFDSQYSVLKMIEAIEKETGRKVADKNNAYFAENRLQSINSVDIAKFEKKHLSVIMNELSKMINKGETMRSIDDYVQLKHGLERNSHIAWSKAVDMITHSIGNGATDEQIEAYQEHMKEVSLVETEIAKISANKYISFNERLSLLEDVRSEIPEYNYFREMDQSGLKEVVITSNSIYADLIKGDSENRAELIHMKSASMSLDYAEGLAKQMIEEFEASNSESLLLDKISDLNNALIDKQVKCGLYSIERGKSLKVMYRHYVPLRGFDEIMGNDVYDYNETDKDIAGKRVEHKVKGRTSRADAAIPTLFNNAEMRIAASNRNVMKQHFYRMAVSNETDLLTVSDSYLQRVEIGPNVYEYHEIIPKIEEGAERWEIEEAIQDYLDLIADLKRDHPDDIISSSNYEKLHLPYRVINGKQSQHVVTISVDGNIVKVFVNGNPKAAQAINGALMGVELEGWLVLKDLNRKFASVLTSYNPAFIFRNLYRDINHAFISSGIKDGSTYSGKVAKNMSKNAVLMKGLVNKYEKGKLSDNNETERLFNLFIENGGETGYIAINTIDEHAHIMSKRLKLLNHGESAQRALTAFDIITDKIEFWNRCSEDVSRFSTFQTSMQMGKSLERSIWDAKDITVNFNKKGSQRSFPMRILSSAYMFVNPALQGLSQQVRMYKEHPARIISVFAGLTAMGIAIRATNMIILSFMYDPDDDRRLAYDNLPDYMRQKSICFVTGKDSNGDPLFMTIPLSLEWRFWYGLGDRLAQYKSGNVTSSEAIHNSTRDLLDFSPLNPLAGTTITSSLVPDILKPIYQIGQNETYFGTPISSQHDYNKDMPEYTKAYSGTSEYLITACKFLNNATGGNKYKKGWGDANPSNVQHTLLSYGGGATRTAIQGFGFVKYIINKAMNEEQEKEMTPQQLPILGSFIRSVGGDSKYYQYNDRFYKMYNEFIVLEQQVKGQIKEYKSGNPEEAENIKLTKIQRYEYAYFNAAKSQDKKLREFKNIMAIVEKADKDPKNKDKVEKRKIDEEKRRKRMSKKEIAIEKKNNPDGLKGVKYANLLINLHHKRTVLAMNRISLGLTPEEDKTAN